MTDEDDSHFYDDGMPVEVGLACDTDRPENSIEIILPSSICISGAQALRLAAALIRIANNIAARDHPHPASMELKQGEKADQGWKCGAWPGMSGLGGNDPSDCDWPVCGCDPYADKVIAALQERGAL